MTGPRRSPLYLSRRDVLRTGTALAAGAGASALLSGCGDSDDGTGAGGVVTVEMWHGQADSAKKAVEGLIKQFNDTHPKIRVRGGGGGVLADSMLQKVTAGLAADSYPDVAYIFGSDLASITRSPQLADLTSVLGKGGGTPWDDYWKPARDAVTVDGKLRAAPALLDSLCVVYNKKLFEQAKVPFPKDGWTWDEFLDTAKRLTDADKGVFGTGWPGVGDEDSVWRMWPMIWDLGGDVVEPDGKSIGFVTPGEQALETLDRLRRDKSVYIDPKPGGEQMYQVFLGGRMAMVATGPWQLPDIVAKKLDYGVVQLPSYSGTPVTISGPDTWAVFDNGSARTKAATEFVTWLMQPKQDVTWGIEGGSLPLSKTASELPAWKKQTKDTEGLQVFVDALDTARVRPTITAYPKISQALGQAVVSVLLGKKQPAQAMEQCAKTANQALAVPS